VNQQEFNSITQGVYNLFASFGSVIAVVGGIWFLFAFFFLKKIGKSWIPMVGGAVIVFSAPYIGLWVGVICYYIIKLWWVGALIFFAWLTWRFRKPIMKKIMTVYHAWRQSQQPAPPPAP
jgi:hypothetical protein